MKVLLLGSAGQLGRALGRSLPAVGDLKQCDRGVADLTDFDSVIRILTSYQPDVIVNAAAYTAVDQAENNRELAFKVNAAAVGKLAGEAARRGIWLIHYSTDYVFDGSSRTPYSESDLPKPINVYGESKLEGERLITESGCKHYIFRLSWVIGEDGNNFAKTILRLAACKNRLEIVEDQFGVPTTPALVARVTLQAIRDTGSEKVWPSGIYHLAPRGITNWYRVAERLLNQAEAESVELMLKAAALEAISGASYFSAARRPDFSCFNTDKVERQLGFRLPHWESEFSQVANVLIKGLITYET